MYCILLLDLLSQPHMVQCMICSHGPRYCYLCALPLLCTILALLTVPVEARHCEAAVLLGGALHLSTEVLYHEGDVGQDCLCLKVPRSQGDPSTAISLGSMEVTWRRE